MVILLLPYSVQCLMYVNNNYRPIRYKTLLPIDNYTKNVKYTFIFFKNIYEFNLKKNIMINYQKKKKYKLHPISE